MTLLVALGAMLALALAVPLVVPRLGRDTGYPLAAGFLAVGMVLASAAPTVLDGGAVTAEWTWLPSLGVTFALRLDGLAAVFCLLVLSVGALIMAYCPRYLDEHAPHGPVYSLLTLFAAAMIGLVLAADVVLLFVFWELTTVCSYFLISTAGAKAGKPATRALLVTAAGGLGLLLAVVLLTIAAGTTDLTSILADPDVVLSSPLSGAIGALIIFAAFTKSAQLPFGFWLPGAMVAMTPVSAYLHAATMVKAGIYLLMRFTPVFGEQPAWQVTLVGVGLTTAVVGALLALREHDLKAILAQSTVSQLGLLVAAIGVGTTTALAAAVLHTIAHALFKATLFMLVGIIDKEAGSRDIRELSGLRRVMPVTATLTGLAGLSMAGVPPLIGFVSKESLFEGFVGADFAPWAGPVAGTLAVVASALTFAYGMRIFHGAFGGPLRQPQLYEPSPAFLVPVAVSAIAGLVLGPWVTLLNPVAGRAVADVAPVAGPTDFELWHGLSPELAMSALTIAAGLTLFLAREPVDRALQRLPVPDGGTVFDRGQDAVLRFGAVVGRPDRTGSPAAVMVRPVVALLLVAVVGAVTVRGLPAPVPAVSALDWPVLALLGVTVVGAVATRSTLAAVAMLGMAGLVVALWFLLAGAPDVALTLLLVEVLTTVVAVYVLRGLPRRLPRTRRSRTAPAAVLAVVAGGVAGLATVAFTGRRELSPVGDYFLRNAEAETGGTNVVNTILVDFRGMDTFGEAIVVGAAALGLLMILGRRDARDGPPAAGATPAAGGPAGGQAGAERPGGPDATRAAGPRPAARDIGSDALVMKVSSRILAPGMAVLSAYLFLRGHDEPGGGFIAALVAGIAVGFVHLAHGPDATVLRRLRPEPLVGAGLLVSLAVGLAAQLAGEPFLTPVGPSVSVPVLGVTLSSVLVFDLGIYLMVLGLLVAAVDRLGADAGPRPVSATGAAGPVPEPAAAGSAGHRAAGPTGRDGLHADRVPADDEPARADAGAGRAHAEHVPSDDSPFDDSPGEDGTGEDGTPVDDTAVDDTGKDVTDERGRQGAGPPRSRPGATRRPR
jgi:multicomponent Na+:H+ antiporter subunit A